jgi:hypothetical protein
MVARQSRIYSECRECVQARATRLQGFVWRGLPERAVNSRLDTADIRQPQPGFHPAGLYLIADPELPSWTGVGGASQAVNATAL